MDTWQEGKIRDFAEVKGGKRLPKGKQLIANRNTHPYIRIRDLGKGKFLQLNADYEYVDDETQKQISRYIVDEGDILISVVGTIGLIGIVGDTLDKANQTENCDKITGIRNLERDYLYYYLISPIGQEEIRKGTVGAVQLKLPLKNVQDITVRYPSLSIQKKISSILSKIDDKIEANRCINDNLEQQAFSLFFKMISSAACEETELDQIAELNPRRQLAKGSEARYIDMAQLSTSGSFPDGWITKPYNGGIKFINGDTILARITPCLENGKAAFVNFLDDSEIAFGSTEYIVMASRGIYPPEFFYCLARYPSFVDYAVKNMNGTSGRQRVSAEVLGKYCLPLLSQNELEEFMKTVPAMFRIIRNNSLENMRLIELRDTLLPRLMSGEIDVSNIAV